MKSCLTLYKYNSIAKLTIEIKRRQTAIVKLTDKADKLVECAQ